MTLQHKAWALVLLTVGLLTSMAVLVSGYSIAQSFSSLERARGEREGERAQRLLAQQMQGLSATGRDYAYWSDAVAFVTGQDPDFMSENFTAENMKSLRISEVLALDLEGAPVASVMLADDGSLRPMSSDTSLLLQRLAAPVLADPHSETVLQTYHHSGAGLMLISIAAVRAQNALGAPPSGALAVVRHFDQTELQRFSDVLMAPVQLSLADAGHSGIGFHMEEVDDTQAQVHAVIRDHDGHAAAELVLGLDRQLYREGRSLAWAAGAQVAVAGLALGALLVFLLDHLLLRRLHRLHRQLKTVSEAELVSDARVDVDGSDELTAVATGLNGLLLRVRQDAERQRQAHEKQEALQMQLMQSQKTEALGRFTGGIAHDFNNSLAAISGWMRVAEEDLDPAHPSHEALQQALKATRYASGLMRQLLAYSRQSAPHLERVSLGALIEDTRSLMAAGLTQRSTLVVQCDTDDASVQADPTQMQQVLVNLLMNASDAMEGRGTIWLHLRSVDLPAAPGVVVSPECATLAEGRYICLTVQDEGPGIAAEHLSRLFDPFFTTKAVGRGTGLGLSVAYGIVARHGGVIGVRSAPGAGACFSLYLPACEPVEETAALTRALEPSGTRELLFVDDDPLVRRAWSTLLQRMGWVVTQAEDGEEAWALFQRQEQDWAVVLTDLAMPKLDGCGLARRIAETHRPPPMVLMSGNVSIDDADHLVETLFSEVLHKPVDAAELERVLKKLVAGFPAEAA
ncbi:ATP-binding protein [Hydrogenophaga sp.]|uniref:ATP-binding protein n=1 Tax=Hydrogenophaga sp. TaxID=1904254 RepID=UPI003563F02F